MINEFSKESDFENKLNKIFDNLSYLSEYVKKKEDKNKKNFDELKSFFSNKIEQIENRLNILEKNDKSFTKKRSKSNFIISNESRKAESNKILKETEEQKQKHSVSNEKIIKRGKYKNKNLKDEFKKIFNMF